MRASILAAVFAGALFGCASNKTPLELTHARQALSRAEASTAARYAEQELSLARHTLEQAERAHQADACSLESRHLAYLAARRAQLAMVEGNIQQAQRETAQAERTLSRAAASIQQTRQEAVEETRRALDDLDDVDLDETELD